MDKQVVHNILLYDGDCMMCSSLIKYVRRYNKQNKVRLMTVYAKDFDAIYKRYLLNIDKSIDQTVFYIHGDVVYDRSDALIELSKSLSWQTRWLQLGYLIPKGFRDYLYMYLAKNRIAWFGRPDSCELP